MVITLLVVGQNQCKLGRPRLSTKGLYFLNHSNHFPLQTAPMVPVPSTELQTVRLPGHCLLATPGVQTSSQLGVP